MESQGIKIQRHENAARRGRHEQGLFGEVQQRPCGYGAAAHWEAGAKQNFDTSLYTAHTILYIRVEDYGPKPKIGKQLVLDKGTKSQRTYTINLCQEESGVYRMTMERTRQ